MAEKYYTIKDVSRRTGMAPSTLRFYGRKGLLPFVRRSDSGTRVFTEADFEPLYVIQCLKASGMALQKIQEFMALYLEGDSTLPQRRRLFEEHRAHILQQMQTLQQSLDLVEYKCWFFAQAEAHGSAEYFCSMSPDQLPQPIQDFYSKVDAFRSRKP